MIIYWRTLAVVVLNLRPVSGLSDQSCCFVLKPWAWDRFFVCEWQGGRVWGLEIAGFCA